MGLEDEALVRGGLDVVSKTGTMGDERFCAVRIGVTSIWNVARRIVLVCCPDGEFCTWLLSAKTELLRYLFFFWHLLNR